MKTPLSADDSSITQRLLEASANRDPRALSKLLQRHHNWLLSFATVRIDRRIRSRADAEDVVQETQAAVAARLDDYLLRRPTSFRTWMLKTAYDQLGKFKRHNVTADRRSVLNEGPIDDPSSLCIAEQLLAIDDSPWRRVALDELAIGVQRALARLEEQDRELLLLRYFEGLNNQEIGYLMGITAKAVSKRHGRALRCLHHELLDQGLGESEL